MADTWTVDTLNEVVALPGAEIELAMRRAKELNP